MFKQEPAMMIGFIASAVVIAAGFFNVAIKTDDITTLLLAAVPIISAIATRFHVTPTKKLAP